MTADWVAFPKPTPMHLAGSDGGSRDWEQPGYAGFHLDGQLLKRQPFTEGKGLFFTFRDATSGRETYGGGRFFETDPPKGAKVIRDFNKAYNPLCAYNHLYICPVAPRDNHLPVGIPAG